MTVYKRYLNEHHIQGTKEKVTVIKIKKKHSGFFTLYIMTQFQHSDVLLFCTAVNLKGEKLELVFFNSY